MDKNWGAFISEGIVLEPTGKGTLNGLTFAVKDVFSIKDHISSAGNPDWLRTHQPAERTAASVERLLASGALLSGMTHTDEIMYSLNGENTHYGTPINPKAPNCIPGGSSSGSAVAVAAQLVDFALGTDTGGSVRIPSSYCGIYGYRPTHNVVTMDGIIPLAQSFDTLGWMANDSNVLLKVGEALLPFSNASSKPFNQIYAVKEAWDLLDNEGIELMRLPFQAVKEIYQSIPEIEIAPEGLNQWMNAFRHIQGLEIWREHGEWIKRVNPTFGPGISDRFQFASSIQEFECQSYFELKDVVSKRLAKWLGEDTLFIIPTAPGTAPLLNQTGEWLEQRRSWTLQLSCIAGLAGLPQVHIPYKAGLGAPVGISIIAGPNQDLKLLQWVNQHASILTGEVLI